MARASVLDEIAAVSAICQEIGFGTVEPTVLKAAHHTSLLILPHLIVARVQSAEPIEVARATGTKEIAIARHLAGRGAPTLAPIEELAGPYVTASCVVTFWPYLAHQRVARESDAPIAAASLATVHAGLAGFRGALPPYTAALDRCWTALNHDGASAALTLADRTLLKAAFRHLRGVVEASRASWVPLHGDAHLGNLLLREQGPVWLDFEDACLGPREYDIANLPADVWPTFLDTDPTLVTAYAHLKSVCVAFWCSADISRSVEVQEAAGYHLDRVREWAR